MHIQKPDDNFVASMTDVDLSQPLSNAEQTFLDDAFVRHPVLIFQGQCLEPQDLLRVAGYFGRVAQYPFGANLAGFEGVTEVIKNEDDRNNFGGVWHSDTSYTDEPPIASLLYARTVPPTGGDTIFADMYAAWEALSPAMREMLTPLRSINTSELRSQSGNNIRSQFRRSMAVTDTDTSDLSAMHRIARVHPRSGRTALYVNSAHSKSFDGFSADESAPLLTFLFQHLKGAEFCNRVRWRPDQLVVWDNRCTQHYAVNDYHGHRRVMQRVTIKARD